MSDQEEVLRGVIRQTEREAAATELYLKSQIRQLKEQLNDNNKGAFQGGWVARDSISGSRHVPYENIDEHGDRWYAAWVEDEERKL